jgi:hypothetical protein
LSRKAGQAKLYGTCNSCGGTEFGKHPTLCKPCMAARSLVWRRTNPEKAKESVRKYQSANPDRLKANRRRHHVKSTYGITVEQYDELLHKQNGRCAICNTDKPDGPGKCFVVDHDHKRKSVRGLLCCKCNFVLGHANDDPAILASSIKYLAGSK